ncbi:hypothetical protein SWSSV_gp155 [White spot syndrome virus]|uniref:Uncharacterized protein n=1 Tax=White spot syndrome virus TaxID=342409 RepID=A0A0S2E6Z1_9VIRU|nr:hypothetical protein SWSSV_gp155 [White spot syndrome virus]ALN66598.1 hypothetical protein [White spot syndrome virus]WUY11324.1 hypothetical protein [White spot syndrome virus]WUY11496.1 hypothetical protein [White spot syndrome virus]WUY11669.1 hypothetical protein [White spot syndrome virus]WUY11842.1 hypothetical protein [White spot syndrome virus]
MDGTTTTNRDYFKEEIIKILSELPSDEEWIRESGNIVKRKIEQNIQKRTKALEPSVKTTIENNVDKEFNDHVSSQVPNGFFEDFKPIYREHTENLLKEVENGQIEAKTRTVLYSLINKSAEAQRGVVTSTFGDDDKKWKSFLRGFTLISNKAFMRSNGTIKFGDFGSAVGYPFRTEYKVLLEDQAGNNVPHNALMKFEAGDGKVVIKVKRIDDEKIDLHFFVHVQALGGGNIHFRNTGSGDPNNYSFEKNSYRGKLPAKPLTGHVDLRDNETEYRTICVINTPRIAQSHMTSGDPSIAIHVMCM